MGNTDDTIQCSNCLSLNTKDSVFCNKCGTQLEQDRETLAYSEAQQEQIDKFGFSPGENFGTRYRIIEEIGRGGMGVVYKAEDKELGITVALKMIRPAHSKNPRFIERFRKETLLARSISHENIIRIYDLGEIDAIKYISMEYIKGQSLKDLIHTSGFLTIETTINISKQICKALNAAHQKGIVHRDMKPQNIMIDGDGNVHVMDFGVAKSFEEEETSIFKGITGTPPYLSPERAKGEKADQRSDIYSLGIIIFEMLTGKRPFEAETTEGYIHKHLYEKPPSPSKYNSQIPSFLERIILKCLVKDNEKRYQNAEEILEEFEIHDKDFDKKSTYTKTKKWSYAAGSIIVLTLVTFIGIFLLKGTRGPEIVPRQETGKISVAVMLFENLSKDERLVHLPREIQLSLITDLSQSKYIGVLPDDRLYQALKKLNHPESKKYSSDILNKIAAEANVDYFVLGSIGSSGDNLRITFRIRIPGTNEVLSADKVPEMRIDSFNPLVDQLAAQIRSKFLTSQEIAGDIDRDIENITTKSPEARSLYIQGRVFYNERSYEKSIELLEKAVAIDPGFAMAHVLMASGYSYLGYVDQENKHHLRAYELKDRVSDKERFRILGNYYANFEHDEEKAIAAYQNLLQLYPDDEEAIYLLGVIYENLEEWDTALEWFNKVLEINNKSEKAYIEIAYTFMAKGLYDIARNNLQVNKHYFPSQSYFHRLISHTYLYQGRYDLALQEVEKALALKPDDYRNRSLEGNIYQIQGDFKSALKCYKKLLEDDSPEAQTDGHLWSARLYLLQGQYEKCRAEIIRGISHSQKYNLENKTSLMLFLAYINLRLDHISKAVDYANQVMEIDAESKLKDKQKWALHLRGLIYLKMRRMEEAEKTAEQLKQLISETWNKKHMRHYLHLIGEIALAHSRQTESIENFRTALSLLPSQCYDYEDHPFYMESLASAYEQTGDSEEARKHYEKISTLTWGQVAFGDIYALSFYRLGKIFQQEGSTDKAIDYYEKFLELWDGADPNLAETADAKIQLEVLRAG
jgi:serine/threonine protein kinase/Flp pilus assembly protein TadD